MGAYHGIPPRLRVKRAEAAGPEAMPDRSSGRGNQF